MNRLLKCYSEHQSLADRGVTISYNFYPPLFPPALYTIIPTANLDAKKMPVQYTMELYRMKAMLSFINIRNPFTRLFSSWKDKMRIISSKIQKYYMVQK